MDKTESIPLKKRPLFTLAPSVLLLVLFILLDLISLLPNNPYESFGERFSSDWFLIFLFTILSVLLGRKIWKDLQERKMFSTRIPLQETHKFWTILYILVFPLTIIVPILIFLSALEYKPWNFALYARIIIFLAMCIFSVFLLAREISRELRKQRVYAIFDINGIHIYCQAKKIDISWDQISRIGYQAVVEGKSDFPEGWGFLAMSLKSERDEILKNMETKLLENRSILKFEQIKDYFGNDKLDLYLMMSFQRSQRKLEYVNKLIEYKVMKPTTFEPLIDARDEQHYKDILKENFNK